MLGQAGDHRPRTWRLSARRQRSALNDISLWFGAQQFEEPLWRFFESAARRTTAISVVNADRRWPTCRQRGLVASAGDRPPGRIPGGVWTTQVAWTAHLDRLGISALKVNTDPVMVDQRGRLVAAASEMHGFLHDTVIVSDEQPGSSTSTCTACGIGSMPKRRSSQARNTFTDAQPERRCHVSPTRRLQRSWRNSMRADGSPNPDRQHSCILRSAEAARRGCEFDGPHLHAHRQASRSSSPVCSHGSMPASTNC